ncbi:hypothetical protein E2562_020010 [Oryza meyeriana var. granulata]|uniref:Uncharacterized protein n=1 Tax=Oryza meyeriana var. granulata TaxID=110450 RepID=A0A6G1FAC8_9ORYZ|nr:hypothetical protein E2562_020010 [Oryza meyeriana var. granulata]
MKKASRFLKDIFSAIVAAVKARSTAVRAKTSAVRTRLIVFGILRNKKLLLSAINRKIHAIVSSGSSHGEYGGEVTTHHGSGGGESCGAGGEQQHHLSGIHLLGGNRKAAVLQSLPSFVVEQERSAVVLLSSLPSFAMDRDGGGGGEEREEEEHEQEMGGKQQLSVIELARGAAEDGGVEFRLEDEIDHVADVFIRRFHEQIKLQKLESFKRLCEILDRN